MTYTVSSGTLNPSIPYHTIIKIQSLLNGMFASNVKIRNFLLRYEVMWKVICMLIEARTIRI